MVDLSLRIEAGVLVMDSLFWYVVVIKTVSFPQFVLRNIL